MEFKSVLPDVEARLCASVRTIKDPVYSEAGWQVNQNEFRLQAPGVGSFYARDGKEVEFSVEPEADPGWVNLYLNGQVLVALLHQRKIMNFHASSFIHNSRGILILGETGAGKSSLTASFSLNGAGFLSDDLTPVVFRRSEPYIRPVCRDIKLRENTVGQLNISPKKLREAEAGTGKQYLHINSIGLKDHRLNTILKIEVSDTDKLELNEPSPAEKFSLLRSEICSWEMLAGMQETEAAYLQQLLHIVEQVRFVRVVRPAVIEIAVLHDAVSNYLDEGL